MSEQSKTAESQSLLTRFAGSAGQRLLESVVAESSLFRGVAGLGRLLTESPPFDVPRGNVLIQQGGSDNDIYLIVSGEFDIVCNGRVTARRRAGEHLGEMAVIDAAARRSASAVAVEHSLVWRMSEPKFSEIANNHPFMWRRLAAELGRRLRERSKFIPAPRSQPVLFVGCSTEALAIAREVQSIFSHDPVVVELWVDGVFAPSSTPIEDLTVLASRIDLGVLLLTPDDVAISRDVEKFGPRDNVVFELGLVMGAIGRERTFLMVPRGLDLKIPSDLLGVRPLDYPLGPSDTVKSRLGPCCNELRKAMNRLGPR